MSDRDWLRDQIRERLSFYQSMTTLGFARERDVVRSQLAPPARSSTSATAATGTPPAQTAPKTRESLEIIRADLGDCTRCVLHEKRTHLVFGVGNPDADLMFIGEGPGYEEDRQGIAFVGPAGQLLTKIINAIDLGRDEVYIANVVKCRPPKNRDPEPEEVAQCRPFLIRQIDAVRPKVICALGRIAAQHLLETDEGITRIRGRIYSYRGAKLVPTFHPAYLLRNAEKKRECWEDMKLIRRLLNDAP
jgi:DNA polymerase